jgi:hypothetical protein
LTQGQRFAIVAKIEAPVTGWVEFGTVLNPGTVTHYKRTQATLNTPPSDPFGTHSSVQGPEVAFYVDFSQRTCSRPSSSSVRPITPSLPAPRRPSSRTSPTRRTARPIFDKMASYELEVTRVSDGAVMFGGPGAVFPASFSERSASEFSRVYTGAALTPGSTVYRWRANVRDDAGLASNWSGYRDFTVNALGVVNTALDGLPTGVQDGDTSLLDFTGRWVHPTSLHMTQAQIFLYKDGVLFRKSDLMTTNVTPSASPGASFTLSHTFTGLGKIPPGTYGYTIAGKASDGQWSPESDPRRIFIANALPTTPSNLHPPSGSASSTLPLFEWNVDDPDDHDVFGVDADSEIEITRPDATIATITTTNYDTTRGVGYWQATTAVFNQFGAYKIRVRGRDTSAGSLGLGAWSSQIVFSYTAGLIVTITNPTEDEVFTTSVPTITWTVSGGTPATTTFALYRQDNPSVAFASGTLPSGATSFQVPIGLLANGGAYEVVITATTSLGVSGSSLRRQFTVLFTAPDPLTNVNATGVAERHDYAASPSTMLISWDITKYPLGEFAGYIVRRRKATELPSQAIVLRWLKTPGQNSWRDYWVESRTVMIYGVSQLRRVGGVILESPIVEVSAQLVLAVPVLVHATEPSIRFPLMYVQSDYSMSSSVPTTLYTTWGSKSRPTAVTAPISNRTRKAHVGLTIVGDNRGTLYDHMADYEQMMTIGGPFLLRTERPEEQFYCKIDASTSPQWKRGDGVGTRVVALDLIEVDFTPGEQGGS